MTSDANVKPPYDAEIKAIADYVLNEKMASELAMHTASLCLMDSIGCMMLALQYPACKKLLGPVIPGTTLPIGARVPGTDYLLDPILAAFNIGTMVRWLDFNDTWLAAEWGHPSDNLGAILSLADYLSRLRVSQGQTPLLIKDVLAAMIKAHEIQGVLALENAFNRLGLDHVFLVKIASTAVAAYLLGGTHEQIMSALSQAFIDGAALRTYRHAPNTGSRKSWAAGDATSRAVRLAWLTLQGENGYPSALSVKKWGFNDNVLRGKTLNIAQKYNSYVMENILFKISYPAEFHAQTAVECAIKLHTQVKDKFHLIDKINLETQESAVRIISKTGPLHNPADRDHCLQYMVAVALLKGDLTADYYENDFADEHEDIEELRDKMLVAENIRYTKDYLDPDKRSIANSMQIFFKDGTITEKIEIEYPIGHKRRREQGIPFLYEKFLNNMHTHYDENQAREMLAMFKDYDALVKMPVNEFMDKFVV